IYKNPDLAKTLRMFAKHGRKAFYTGEVARAIVAKSTALAGTMTLGGSRDLQRQMGRGDPRHVSWLRAVRGTAAGAVLERSRESQHPGSVRAAVGTGTDTRGPLHEQSGEVLAPRGGGEEALLQRSVPVQRRSGRTVEQRLARLHRQPGDEVPRVIALRVG